MTPGWLRRWAEAWLIASLGLIVEATAVFIVARAKIATPLDFVHGFTAIVPLGMLLALPVAGLGAAASAALERHERRVGVAGVALLAAAYSCAVSLAVSTGRHLEGSRRPAFVLLVTLAGGALGWKVAGPLGRWLVASSTAARAKVALVLAAAFGALEVVNATVLPRLYPGFHGGLGVLSLALLGLGGFALRGEDGRPRGSARSVVLGSAAVLLLALGLGVTAPKRLRYRDNLRLVYHEHAPLLVHAVELAARLDPPPPLDDEPLDATPRGGERLLDLGSRDVLLVTIDALRADHVGAYGYARKTTPRLDALARDGVVFDAAYTATPHTSYAVTSLMTGKNMRPLLSQGLGADSETLPEALRRYDFHTAAFYPPAVFFVDKERFESFESRGLGFEYRKEQFATAGERAEQLGAYLATRRPDERVFVWVHLFEPHEPYVAHPGHDFGERAIDRYDSEIGAADEGLGAVVDVMRASRPSTLVVVTADHGEEFGEHGGRYHGTTVYDEQVRVPLVMHAPGLLVSRRVETPVSLVDIAPTLLSAAGLPLSPRIRGRDLGPELVGRAVDGSAFSETDDQTLLARGRLRLICARKLGACRLHELESDPGELVDVSAERSDDARTMKTDLRRYVTSLGRFEAGADSGWPQALRRAMSGDVEVAPDVAALLGDAALRIRRQAAETLMELAAPVSVGESGSRERGRDLPTPSEPMSSEDVTEPLRRATSSDEDDGVRDYAALALTRLGQGAPRTFDLVRGADPKLRRLAALVLAERGDDRGKDVLVEWWSEAFPPVGAPRNTLPFNRARQLLAALAKVRYEAAVVPLTRGLADVRLRRYVAPALAALGSDAARPALASALAVEPYHDARLALARAIVDLGGRAELLAPMVHLLGVPDPLPSGLELARRADLLAWIGGPNDNEIGRLSRFATSGVAIGVTIPEGGNGQGVRVFVRARSTDGAPGEVRVGPREGPRAVEDRTRAVPRAAPRLEPERAVTLRVESTTPTEVYATLPAAVSLAPRDAVDLIVYATQNVEVESLAAVPLADDVTTPSRPR